MIKSRRISTQFELESTFFVIMKTNNGQVNDLFSDSLFLLFLKSPLMHYIHAVLSVSLLHPLGPNERSLIEQFVDEDGVIILHRLYCIVFSPLLVGYLDVLTQRQTNSDILKTPFSQQFLASFTSTLFHILSFIMLSFENLTQQQSLSSSKGHKSAGPLRKEFKSKFDLPNVFKSPTNSHKTQSASEFFTLVDDSYLLLLKENDQKAELARVLSPTARTSLTASPPLRLFNPRPYLRMSIVRQPTPATPQQFTAGRSTHPLDDNITDEISGDMRLAIVQYPATRFESDDSDSEPPPPPLDSPSPGPSTPVPTPPPENEEWESGVLLPSPPQTMPTLTQRRQRMLLVSVQIITHSLSLLIPPVCDDFTRLLNLGTNRASPNEKASEERIVNPTQIPDTILLSVVLDSTQQFTFDISAARKGYNVGNDAELHTLLHYSLAAFLMLFNEAFHATSFNLTQNPQRMETMLIMDRHDPRLNQVSNDAFNEAEAEAV
ncbi:hypothetical protein BLNAU_9689 [Blattamonas nauphoetae]|uniref:Uncharacterized protein n=1 Tax=Blattamonas nauphoetae TaxID=2049346 RepID=A0ABQ9XUZ2_9EUKA|nr:hypothetical protein BLNAU_9689 [Blattamonas nauphoetae]